MEEVLDVFGVVEGGAGGGRLGRALLRPRFSRVYALEDAEPPEVWEGDLEFADGLGAGDVVFGVARRAWALRSARAVGTDEHSTYPSS